MVHAFRRNRALTTAVVVTLSIGVGVSAAMFNLVDVLLFRPPAHVTYPDRLVEVPSASNFVRYRRLQRQAQSLELAAHTRMPVTIGLGRGPDAFVMRAECVSENYFQVLGVRPIVGRGFSDGITPTDGSRPVILSNGLWRRLFSGATNAIGATLELGGSGHTVVGVAPANFTGVQLEPVDVWLALTHSPELCLFTGQSLLSSSSSAWLSTIGRVRDPFTIEQAAAEVAATGPRPFAALADAGLALRPLASSRRARLAQDGRMAFWLAGGALLVLLIAGANVAVLLALRAFERRLEIAIRIQLGATRRRVFLLLFVENLALALPVHRHRRPCRNMGGHRPARILPHASRRANQREIAEDCRRVRIVCRRRGQHCPGRADRPVQRVALAARRPAGDRRWIPNTQRPARAAARLRPTPACGQWPVRAIRAQPADECGLRFQPIIVAAVELEREGYSIPDAWSKIDTFVERARSIPAVVSVGVSSDTLLNSGGMTVAVAMRSSLVPRDDGVTEASVAKSMNAVTPNYFATLGTRIRRGRAFTAADDASARAVVIVDQGLAAAEWPGQDPLGRCAYIGSRKDCAEIVGIAEPRRSTFLSRVRKEFFVPAAQAAPYNLHTFPRTLFIRTGAPVREVMPAIVAALQSVVPEVPKGNVRPLLELADAGTKSWRLGARLFSLYGVTAVIMAGVGLYAALALMVRQRTTESAVRMVLGATPGVVMRLVIRQGALLASGWVLGMLLILLIGRFIERLPFEVRPTEPGVLAWATLLLRGVATLGALLPALRAARLNPTEALRQ
jgi:hypothetical protein